MYQIVILLLAFLSVAAACFVFSKRQNKGFDNFLKIFTALFCSIGFFRLMLSDSFVFVINGGYYDEIFYDVSDVPQALLRWGYYLNYSVLPMAVFFNSRLFRNIASYVCLPFSLLSCVFFNEYMPYFLDERGRGLHFTPAFRYAYFIIELSFAIAIPVLIMICHRHVFKIKDGREWLNFLTAVPFVIMLVMPVYVPQSTIGYSKVSATQGSTYHFAWIAILLLVTVSLYYVFRFKPYSERYMLCVFLTLVLFFHYDSLYLMGFSIPRLPIQLCNIASYFYMIAILFRMNKMFQFCFIANVTGAIIAIMMPDFLNGAFGFWNMHFILEHSLVLMIPALAMGLRIFPRVTRKTLKYTWIGFTAYFLFCLTVGVILNGYSDVTGFEVNYFFLFDLGKAFDYFPFLRFVENFRIGFGRFEFYPIFVAIMYSAFLCMCVVFYHAVKFFYKMEDDHLELRASAIELYEQISGKTATIPKEFVD